MYMKIWSIQTYSIEHNLGSIVNYLGLTINVRHLRISPTWLSLNLDFDTNWYANRSFDVDDNI